MAVESLQEIRSKQVEEYLRLYEGMPSNTIARMLRNHFPLLFKSVEQARTAVRYKRGNNGERDRKVLKNKEFMRENQKSGYTVPLPQSDYEEWIPYNVEAKGTIAIIADLHIPYHHEGTLKLCLDHLDVVKPDMLIINGDLIDCYMSSKFCKDPTKRDLQGEVDLVIQFLVHLKQRYNNSRILYKFGNHENRHKRFVFNNAPILWGVDKITLESLLELDDIGIDYVDNDRPIVIADFTILHGHELQGSGYSIISPARSAFLKTYSNCIIAHHHRTSEYSDNVLNGYQVTVYSIGCLCGLHMEYARINKWNNGFIIMHIAGGKMLVSNMKVEKGRITKS